MSYAFAVDIGDLLVGEVKGERGAAFSIAAEAGDEVAIKNVDGNAARFEAQFAIRITGPRESFGEIAVFDDKGFSVTLTKNADLLTCVGFGHHLAGEIGLIHEMKSDESRVETAHERIIDLEVANRVDPVGLH